MISIFWKKGKCTAWTWMQWGEVHFGRASAAGTV